MTAIEARVIQTRMFLKQMVNVSQTYFVQFWRSQNDVCDIQHSATGKAEPMLSPNR